MINRFVLTVAGGVPSGAGLAVYRAAATFEEKDRRRSRSELRRYFALCERARCQWAAKAIEQTGEWGLNQGLQSLEPVWDAGSASYAGWILNEYRRHLEEKPGTGEVRQVLLQTELALRAAGRLPVVPDGQLPYRVIARGVEAAAQALVAAWEAGQVQSLPEETAETVRELDRISSAF